MLKLLVSQRRVGLRERLAHVRAQVLVHVVLGHFFFSPLLKY